MTTRTLPYPLLQALVGDEEVEALFSNEAELSALLRAEAALAQAEARVGLISNEAAKEIAEACGSFQADWAGLQSRSGRGAWTLARFNAGLLGTLHQALEWMVLPQNGYRDGSRLEERSGTGQLDSLLHLEG